MVPRLREYRVTPYSRTLERQRAILRAAIYVVCFVLGVAAGLGTAQVLSPKAAAPAGVAAAEEPVVTVRTLLKGTVDTESRTNPGPAAR